MGILTNEFVEQPNTDTLTYNVKTSEQVTNKYKNASDVAKEIMGRAFLETLTFTELIVHDNRDCFKKLQGRFRLEAT